MSSFSNEARHFFVLKFKAILRYRFLRSINKRNKSMKKLLAISLLSLLSLNLFARDYVKTFTGTSLAEVEKAVNAYTSKTKDDIKAISITESPKGTFVFVVVFDKDD